LGIPRNDPLTRTSPSDSTLPTSETYSSNWQIKEHVWYGTKKVDIDLPRIRAIIDKVGYRGFTPIEALGEGDPAEVVTAFLHKVQKAFA